MNIKNLVAAAILAMPIFSHAQPIKIIVPFSAGGTADSVARVIEKSLNESFSRDFVVEHKTGAGGTVAARSVARSRGSETVLMVHSAAFVINSLASDADYNIFSDFVPVSLVGHVPMVAVSGMHFGQSKLQDIVNSTGPLSIAHGGIGTAGHLFAEIFSQYIKNPVVLVPYRGESHALADILSNSVNLAIVSLATVTGMKDQHRISILATTGVRRNSQIPQVPTFKELAMTNLEQSVNWIILMANTTADAGLLAKIRNHMSSEDLQKKFLSLGLEPSQTNAADFLRQEHRKFSAMQIKLR